MMWGRNQRVIYAEISARGAAPDMISCK